MSQPAENDAPTWVVHDMTHEHRLCANEKHDAEFGPMTEAQAQDMVRLGRPGAYWAQNLARSSVIPPRSGLVHPLTGVRTPRSLLT